MAKTYWIIAGHASEGLGKDYDCGAVAKYHGNQITEAKETRILRDMVTKELIALGCKVRNDESSWNLYKVINWLSSLVSLNDIAIEFHFNAAIPEAKGVEVMIPINPSNVEIGLARDIANTISTILKSPKRKGKHYIEGVKYEDESQHHRLGFMIPKCENVLVETCFISNPYEMESYYTNRETLAKELAKIISKY